MRKIEKYFEIKISEYDSSYFNLSESIFFDIETTSLSSSQGQIYLIAVIHKEDGLYKFIQWFAENLSDEKQIIIEFKEYIKDFRYIYHFNGDTFDIPFVEQAAKAYYIEDIFSHLTSIDIYKKLKVLKKLYPINSLRQKSLEKFIGLHREDIYNGGELISVYHHYVSSKDEEALKVLLLHNEEDVLGMLRILPLVNTTSILCESSDLNSLELLDDCIIIRFTLKRALLKDIYLENDKLILYTKKTLLVLEIKLYKGEAKYFIENYKDYYYLTLEDMAVHKSLAEFVDKSVKLKARKDTAYIRLDATFIPAYNADTLYQYKLNYKDKTSLINVADVNFSDTEFLLKYLRAVLKSFI